MGRNRRARAAASAAAAAAEWHADDAKTEAAVAVERGAQARAAAAAKAQADAAAAAKVIAGATDYAAAAVAVLSAGAGAFGGATFADPLLRLIASYAAPAPVFVLAEGGKQLHRFEPLLTADGAGAGLNGDIGFWAPLTVQHRDLLPPGTGAAPGSAYYWCVLAEPLTRQLFVLTLAGPHACYDLRTGAWRPIPRAPKSDGRTGAAACVVPMTGPRVAGPMAQGGPHPKLVVCGGRSGSQMATATDVFDVKSGVWSQGGGLSDGCIDHACVGVESAVYLIGGVQKNPPGSVQYWSASRACRRMEFGNRPRGYGKLTQSVKPKWEYHATLCTARSQLHATVCAGGLVVVSGGQNDDDERQSTLEVLHTAGAYSSAFALAPCALAVRRSGHAAVAVDCAPPALPTSGASGAAAAAGDAKSAAAAAAAGAGAGAAPQQWQRLVVFGGRSQPPSRDTHKSGHTMHTPEQAVWDEVSAPFTADAWAAPKDAAAKPRPAVRMQALPSARLRGVTGISVASFAT